MQGSGSIHIAIVAGETSGDQLGAGLIEALRSHYPQARFEGIAGPRMLAAGCESLYPMERLSVMGLVETAGRWPEVLTMRRDLLRRYRDDPPAAFIGVDAPDFNLSLERMLRETGVPTVHYASPSVWAWRRYRLPKIRRSVDRMLVLLPFEADFYAEHGIRADFVGHPLADQVTWTPGTVAARERLGLNEKGPVVALLPGSRMGEVGRLAGSMVGAARWLGGRKSGVRFVVPLIDSATTGRFQQAIDELHDRSAFTLLDGRAHDAMEAADVVLLASGTATLEALLVGRPMVITYRIHPMTWSIGRRMLHVPFVGLPNLLAGRLVAPELLQDAATPGRLGAAVLGLLNCAEGRERQTSTYAKIAQTLGSDASARAAQSVRDLLEERR